MGLLVAKRCFCPKTLPLNNTSDLSCLHDGNGMKTGSSGCNLQDYLFAGFAARYEHRKDSLCLLKVYEQISYLL